MEGINRVFGVHLFYHNGMPIILPSSPGSGEWRQEIQFLLSL